jgi:hypothetical protein
MSKRSRKKSLTKHSLLVLSGLLLLLATGLGATHVWMLFHSDAILLTPPVPNFRAAREIYPYSVVPGGVLDAREVADTIAHDPVARAHYAGIHAELLWAERVKEPILAYVSYRKDDAIHWTAQPVRITKGEIILTDGTNRIRGRCGNRIVVKRPTPIPGFTPEAPPPEIVFDTPLPPLIPTVIVPPVPPLTAEIGPPPGIGPPLTAEIGPPLEIMPPPPEIGQIYPTLPPMLPPTPTTPSVAPRLHRLLRGRGRCRCVPDQYVFLHHHRHLCQSQEPYC